MAKIFRPSSREATILSKIESSNEFERRKAISSVIDCVEPLSNAIATKLIENHLVETTNKNALEEQIMKCLNKLTRSEDFDVDFQIVHNSENVLGLILAFYVSFAVPARKTATILRSVFNIKVSCQTVLNYAAAAAFYCHSFNLAHKGKVDSISAGDETYIKVMGKHHYVFFFISSQNLKITAYHVADNRGTQHAIIAMNEAIRTATPKQKITLVTDGNPSYPAGIHFLNAHINEHPDIQHRKVIGLQNLDDESEEWRSFKQLIERLNRTCKYHVKPAAGFNSNNGAVSLTTLFVTHYNFLRPHMSLLYKPPVHLPELANISTIQGKWTKILSLAA